MPVDFSRPWHRRQFLGVTVGGFAGLTLSTKLSAAAPENAVDVGQVHDGQVSFPVEGTPSEPSAGAPPNPWPVGDRIGFAVVGLGRLSLNQILPAFGSSRKARLAAVVTGTPEKGQAIAAQYGLPTDQVYHYDNFEKIAANPAIQAVYIVLPNSLHAEYTVRAAHAGKHVLCEKPMATSSDEARKMIAACSQAGKRLMIAYRCQYEPHNRRVIEDTQAKKLGSVRIIEACNYQNVLDNGQWRLRKALAGGGSLPDVGLYCLNTSRAILNEEPTEVFATISNPPNDPRFREVEDLISFTLRFPSGALANCSSSYGLHQARRLRVYGTEASFNLDHAFDYHGQKLEISRLTEEIEHAETLQIPFKDQFALELDHFAECVKQNLNPYTPGEEGLQDHLIMEAIYKSAQTGRPVTVPPPIAIPRGPIG